MKKITVTTDEKGNAQIHMEGFKGKECLTASAELERDLGIVGADGRTPTAEMHQRQNQQQQLKGGAK